jgi:glycosyltransferase involved in cell wall biosynthesis
MSKISIIYAYRNRDEQRIENSLLSLAHQNTKDFEVIFVDYGSDKIKAESIRKVIASYAFASYYYIAHPGLLWNKSKALNYAAFQAKGEFIFVADVDVCFSMNAVKTMQNLIDRNKFYLFKLSYLKQEITQTQIVLGKFTESQIKHHGDVNGMILVSKPNFFSVKGYDEFYHFYGSEDVDFYDRLKNSGLDVCQNSDTLFFHQWHPIYNSINDTVLEVNPRFFNIKKINQQHFFFQQKEKATTPILNQDITKNIWKKEDELSADALTKNFEIANDHAKVWHLFKIVLPSLNDDVISVIVREDEYFSSLKYSIKKQIKKSDRVPISMKAVSDMILEEILLNYRHHNYSYKISEDLKVIVFILAK